MPVVSPSEVLLLLVLAAIVIYFRLRSRVSGGILAVTVLVLSPPVAFVLGQVIDAVLSLLPF